MKKLCDYCEEPIHPKRAELGYMSCKTCAEKYTVKSVGISGSVNKSNVIEVIKNPGKDIIHRIKNSNNYGANLGLSSPLTEEKEDNKIRVNSTENNAEDSLDLVELLNRIGLLNNCERRYC